MYYVLNRCSKMDIEKEINELKKEIQEIKKRLDRLEKSMNLIPFTF